LCTFEPDVAPPLAPRFGAFVFAGRFAALPYFRVPA
jgi:hypothetical protein